MPAPMRKQTTRSDETWATQVKAEGADGSPEAIGAFWKVEV